MRKLINRTTLDTTTGKTDVIHMGYTTLNAVGVEGAVVGTKLSFEVGQEVSTLLPLMDQDGGTIEITLTSVSSGRGLYVVSREDFMFAKFIRVVSNGTETSATPITLQSYEEIT